MTSTARRIARDLVPPALARALIGTPKGGLSFEDVRGAWQDAEAAAGGYDEESILLRIRAATDEVRSGQAAFERDGIAFAVHEFRWPLAAALLMVAARRGHLSVLDFGGSLGSSYRQHAGLLDGVPTAWGVVEQPTFVEAGLEYEDDRLRFFTTIAECIEAITPNAAVLSSVLQYLPDPDSVLAEIAETDVDVIVIDRTPFLLEATCATSHRATVQRVPEEIYPASYAAWLLSRERLLASAPGWSVLDTFPSIEPDMRTTGGVEFAWSGLILVRSHE